MDYDAEFHAACNWGGSFGYFSDAENLDVLCRLARAVRPGGRVLVDQVNRERILRRFRPRHQKGDLSMVSTWQAGTQRVETTWSVTRGGKKLSCRSSIRVYTPAQFRSLFDRAGLQVTDVLGDWQGGPYGRYAARLVVVGRRA